MKYDFDIIVLGAGSAGLTSAIGFSKVGKKVLLVERDKMGGECTNSGCIPSKSLIHLSKEYSSALERAGKTPQLESFKKNIFQQVQKKILEVRSEESPEVLEKKFGIKVLLGEGSFVDQHQIKIKTKKTEQTFSAKKIVIATGSSARKMKIDGLSENDLLTNENIFQLEKEPKDLLIIGGGPIGCELAEALARLGTKVTIINRSELILSREEKEVSLKAQERFESMGIRVLTNADLIKCEGKTGFLEEKMGNSKKTHKIPFDFVLMAIGRTPNIEHLNLDQAGIKVVDRKIQVDQHYRTNRKHIYAIGDVSSATQFTHTADDQGRHIIKKSLMPWLKAAEKPIPRVTYLDEEIASVGLSSSEAELRYGKEKIIKISIPYENTDRAKTDEIHHGIAIVIAKRLTGKILGVSLMGRNAGELISLFTLCIQNNISLWKLNKVIIPYPILGQLYKKLSDQYIAQTLQNLKPDLLLFFKRQSLRVIALIFWTTLLFLFYRYKSLHAMSWEDLGILIGRQVIDKPWLYILLYTIRPIVFFPASLLTLLSGTLFGFWWGSLYTLIGENFSANFAYWMGRLLGKDVISAHGNGLLNVWKRGLNRQAFLTVLVMRTIYLPFDLVNYSCGIFGIRWTPYTIATAIGIIPGALAFVAFGATIKNIESFQLSSLSFDGKAFAASIVIFLISLAIAYYVRKHERKMVQQLEAS